MYKVVGLSAVCGDGPTATYVALSCERVKIYKQGEADHPWTMYSNCMEFDRSPILTATPIFCLLQIQESCFQICETPPINGTFGGWGSVFDNFHM